jgi:hypothetical protein
MRSQAMITSADTEVGLRHRGSSNPSSQQRVLELGLGARFDAAPPRVYPLSIIVRELANQYIP